VEKRKNDRELWTKWVKKYAERILIDSKDEENKKDYFKRHIALLNSYNPR
jgi:hypothetical protein